MAMPATIRRWTKELVQSLPNDGNRYELVAGDLLVTPAPVVRHQDAVREFAAVLLDYLRPLGLKHTLFFAAADISWTTDDLVQPDLFVVTPEDVSRDWQTFQHLRLVVEVLSPSSRRGDRSVKRKLYQQNRVETYWIVDPDGHTVDVWHPDDAEATAVAEVLTWRVTPDAPELTIDLAEIFRPLP
jgi:Uma2 family endonuclease